MLAQLIVQFEILMLLSGLIADASQHIMDLLSFNRLVQVREDNKVGHTSERRPKVHGQLFARFGGACAEHDQYVVRELGLWTENLFSLLGCRVGVSVKEGRSSRFGEEADDGD